MDFDSIKASAPVNYSSSATQKVPTNENIKADTKIENNNKVKEDKEIVKAKDIYSKLLSENKSENKFGEYAGEKKTSYTEKEIVKMLDIANSKLAPINKSFEYSVHDVTKRLSIKIVDSDTKEVIKEIPPEKEQDALAKMWELAGLLIDEKG